MPSAQCSSVFNSKISCFHILSLGSADWKHNHWILVFLLSYSHQCFTYQVVFCFFHSDLGFSFQRRPKVLFLKDSNSVMVGPKEAEVYLKWRLQLPCSAVIPKFAEIMRLMKSYKVCNAVGNTGLSTYIGRRGLGEKNLTSLVIQMNPDEQGKKGLWREWIHLVCWGMSLTVIMVPWEQCSRVFSCHFFSGLCHFFWTWRSVDSGFRAQSAYFGLCFILFCFGVFLVTNQHFVANKMWFFFLFLMILELANKMWFSVFDGFGPGNF